MDTKTILLAPIAELKTLTFCVWSCAVVATTVVMMPIGPLHVTDVVSDVSCVTVALVNAFAETLLEEINPDLSENFNLDIYKIKGENNYI
jgi:hypothetical protein